jgi:hypothetical protein
MKLLMLALVLTSVAGLVFAADWLETVGAFLGLALTLDCLID